MSMRLSAALQQLAPPALLTYFVWAWRRCTFTIGPAYISRELGRPILGAIYTVLPTLFIPPLTVIFLRLYFLPSTQSIAPHDPPMEIQLRHVIFECLPPSSGKPVVISPYPRRDDAGLGEGWDAASTDRFGEAGGEEDDGLENDLVERCWKGKCKGRWKPARARHCSDCQTCRAGFDHHCAFFANCLTAPYVPRFLLLLILTPPAILLLSLPLYIPLIQRTALAWRRASAGTDADTAWWWNAWWAWIVAGGPVGRWMAGLVLGWRHLDREDAGGVAGVLKVEYGALLGLGALLAIFTAALAYSAIVLSRAGRLTVDRSRAKSLARAQAALADLPSPDLASPHLKTDLARFGLVRWFFVPFPTTTQTSHAAQSHGDGSGVLLPSLPEERPYDHGVEENWRMMFGTDGYKWALPWVTTSGGISRAQLFNWPIREDVRERLEQEAARIQSRLRERGDDGVVP